MQSLILVLLSIGAASAAPQQFFVLPDILASAQTHSGLSHQELVPVVIPIGDHSKQKAESSSSDFDVFMKVPVVNEDVTSIKEDGDLPVQSSNSPNPVEMLLNELQSPQVVPGNEQIDETLLTNEDSETAPIQQHTIPEKIPENLTPTQESGSQTTVEKDAEFESHLKTEEQVAKAVESSLTDAAENLEVEPITEKLKEEPKDSVALEEVQGNESATENIPKTDPETEEADAINQEPAIKAEEQHQHIKETIIDDKDTTTKQEAEEVAVITDKVADIKTESIPQDVVKPEELSQGQEIDSVKTEQSPTKPEDKIHEKTSISTGKTLLQDEVKGEEEVQKEEIVEVEETPVAHTVEETTEVEVQEVNEDKNQSTILEVEELTEGPHQKERVEENLVTELPNEVVRESITELEEPIEQEQETPTGAETPQESIKEATSEQDINTDAPVNDKLLEDASLKQITEEPVQEEHNEKIDETELVKSKTEQIEDPIIQSEDVVQQKPIKIQSSLSEVAEQATPQITEEVPDILSKTVVEAKLTEEGHIQTEQTKSPVQVKHSEDVAQPQLTEVQTLLSEVADQATPQIIKEVPEKLSETVGEKKLSEEAQIQTEHTEDSVKDVHSEDVAQPQPTEVQSSLSEVTDQATPQITEEVPATPSVEAKLAEETPIQIEHSEVQTQITQSEEIAQPQLTEVQVTPQITEEVPETPSESVVKPKLTEEVSATQTEGAVEVKLSEEAPISKEHTEIIAEVAQSSDVAQRQPTEVQSSLSEDAVQDAPQLTEEVPATLSEDAVVVQSLLPEVKVIETDLPVESSGSIAEPASESISDNTHSQANNLEENQIIVSKVSKTKSPAKSNLIPSNGKSFDSAPDDGFRMEPVGLAVQNHFGFSSHMIKMPDPVQYLHNGAIVDPRTLVEPRYRPFFYHNDSPDIVRAKVLFFQHQGNISPKF